MNDDQLPVVGSKVLTPDDGEGVVERVLIPGTIYHAPPYYREAGTEVHDVTMLWARTRIHRCRLYFLDELVWTQKELFPDATL